MLTIRYQQPESIGTHTKPTSCAYFRVKTNMKHEFEKQYRQVNHNAKLCKYLPIWPLYVAHIAICFISEHDRRCLDQVLFV